jgi:hypothetical protein
VAAATPSEPSPRPLSERELRLLVRRAELVDRIDDLSNELRLIELELGL